MLSIGVQADCSSLASRIRTLSEHEITDRSAAGVLGIFTGALRASVQFSSGVRPAYFTAEFDDHFEVGIAGASTAGHFAAIALGCVTPMTPYGGANFMSILPGPAEEIVAVLVAQSIPPWKPLIVVGHSYGGALAIAIASRWKRQFPAAELQVLTMGSFRPGDDLVDVALVNVPTRRIMTGADPIPRLPPHFSEAPAFVASEGIVVAALAQEYVQPGAGTIVTPQGEMLGDVLPPINFPGLSFNLLTWLVGVNGMASNGHSFKTYDNYLRAGLGLGKGQVVVPTTGGFKGEVEVPFSPEAFNLGPVAGVLALLAKGVFVQSVYIPVLGRFSVVRVGTTYNLVWMGFIVGTSLSKSHAKTAAKSGNKFLRVLQTMATVAHLEFGQALQVYLLAAGSSTTGFMPVLTVT